MTSAVDASEQRIDREIRAAPDLIPWLDLTDIPVARREPAELAARAAAGHGKRGLRRSGCWSARSPAPTALG